ncbi:CsbD family protein [Nocardia otitidiscaviarum]|uniref:CsbD family protein n=1 Tax=Nocardia otitidiscaviarum TaxID=1823 RepID=A0A378YB25_9NOCA|nr:CsbD family protein [Nocardia otitidiscaviarum]MBF6137302.1 CsbD family protein [Nocardia otitidiscaviarum]MBF6178618.1 CsbD family protein [Nocardia otitidiscaviarum]MBF6237807.1 CsbD family protein [Nocardia otitidiscaviarum]MBF6488198.1 CsbD family protein [Nocardia otitidiscaviarum]MCP9622111.1 CsbD family protein [Nocardia otitidiscaviarum]
MSLSDKISNKAEDLTGKAKEAAGDVTGDDELRGEGKADQLSAGLKDAAEDIKDAVGDVVDKVKGALGK